MCYLLYKLKVPLAVMLHLKDCKNYLESLVHIELQIFSLRTSSLLRHSYMLNGSIIHLVAQLKNQKVNLIQYQKD